MTPEPRARPPAVPRGVWVLGFVSLCMDLSSEMVHALLPLFMVTALGASMLVVGIVEGVAESTAMIVKVFSGVLSDRWRRRKPLVLAGYGLAALSKFVFPLAPTLGWIVGARFADRVGKGIRGAPRDALIADITPPALRGRSFGLRQALDTVGAIGGPLAAVAAMAYFAQDFQMAFWLAVVPAVLAVALIVVGVDEPPRGAAPHLAGPHPASPRVAGPHPAAPHPAAPSPRWPWRDFDQLPRTFWTIVGLGALLTLARFSEAFLVLRARDVGLDVGMAPLVMVVLAVVYAGCAYPAGAALDRGHGVRLLAGGLLALIAADVLLAAAREPLPVLAGAALWGLSLGLTQGLLSALVAATAPAHLRGTAFGMFNLASGVTLLVASVLAGWLWDMLGPAHTFWAGALFTALAGVALWLRRDLLATLGRAHA